MSAWNYLGKVEIRCCLGEIYRERVKSNDRDSQSNNSYSICCSSGIHICLQLLFQHFINELSKREHRVFIKPIISFTLLFFASLFRLACFAHMCVLFALSRQLKTCLNVPSVSFCIVTGNRAYRGLSSASADGLADRAGSQVAKRAF